MTNSFFTFTSANIVFDFQRRNETAERRIQMGDQYRAFEPGGKAILHMSGHAARHLSNPTPISYGPGCIESALGLIQRVAFLAQVSL